MQIAGSQGAEKEFTALFSDSVPSGGGGMAAWQSCCVQEVDVHPDLGEVSSPDENVSDEEEAWHRESVRKGLFFPFICSSLMLRHVVDDRFSGEDEDEIDQLANLSNEDDFFAAAADWSGGHVASPLQARLEDEPLPIQSAPRNGGFRAEDLPTTPSSRRRVVKFADGGDEVRVMTS